jgi:predicted  nucleic acid-binding Zn-ribbon protein
MSGDDVTITVRVNNQTTEGFRDVNGRLRDMQGRYAAAAASMRRDSDGLTRAMDGTRGSAMSLAPSLLQVGVALGTSVLPALGAAVPAVLGLGTAAATLKLGFAGVDKAMQAAGKGHKEYEKALKQLSPPARDFTKALVDLKGQFKGVGEDIQKVMLPGFTKAVKEAGPVVKILGKSMTDMGSAFGDAAAGVGRMLKDSGFQKDLQTNLKLGTGFVKDMTSAMGPFTRSFLDFGAKSKPTLDALTGLAGGLLSKGLPGMFKGLEPGIQGAAQVIDGLAYALNDKLLPGLGKFIGEYSKATGPLFQQGFKLLGDVGGAALDTLTGALKVASPFLHDLAEGLRAVRTVGGAIAPVMKDVARAIADAIIPGDIGEGPLKRLADSLERNKGAIQEAARAIGDTILTMVQAGVSSLPMLVRGFRAMTDGALIALDGIVSGAAKAFGWVPGIGEKLRAANKDFDQWAGGFRASLDRAQQGIDSFSASTSQKLAAGKLKLDINNWNAQIQTAKEQLNKVPPEKKAALKAQISDLQAKVAAARQQLASLKDKTVTARANDQASGKLSFIQRALNSLDGQVATSYVRTVYEKVEASNAPAFRAMGGPIRLAGGGTPDGGRVVGPGTETSDSVPAMLSAGEYVVRASSVRKYGQRFMDAVNAGTLRVAGFAKGGLTQAQKDARGQISGGLGISYYGRYAGYSLTPTEKSLAAPQDLGSLVQSINEMSGQIRAAFSGRQESSLLRQLDRTGKGLINYDKQLYKVTQSLDAAKSKLDDLRNSASQLSDSVRSGVLSASNITRVASGGGPVTVSSIMGAAIQSRDQAQAFAQALKGLQKKGLDKGLIQDIANAGIEGGGLQTAGALLNASSSEIKTLNGLRSATATYAQQAGQTTADAYYGAAIKAQDKLVNSLKSQQSKLEKAMLDLTRALEKALARAVGKKAAGGIVGAAASGGVRGGLTWVGEHEPELLDLPVGSRVWSGPDSRRRALEAHAPWASMLTTGHRTRTVAAQTQAAGSDHRPVEIHLNIAGKQFGQLWVDVGRKEVKTRGGVSATLGAN